MTYAKIENDVLIYPTDAEFAGIPNWRTNEPAQRKRGYKPLEGTPEEREGYTAEPATWHVVEQSMTRIEPRQTIVEDWEEDPETGERRKTGEHTEMQDTEITLDKSAIVVDSWDYVPIPVPPPEPPPIVRYSKYKIQLATQKLGLWEQVKAAIAQAGLADSWANIVDIASDNPELQGALPEIREAFGSDVVDRVLAESIAD